LDDVGGVERGALNLGDTEECGICYADIVRPLTLYYAPLRRGIFF
jgi:hypothetical protein